MAYGGNLWELVVVDMPNGSAVIQAMLQRPQCRRLLPAALTRPKRHGKGTMGLE